MIIHNSLKKLYEKGYDIDWSKFYPLKSPLIKLPLYPWQEKKYWINVDNSSQYFSNKENEDKEENMDFSKNKASVSDERNIYQEFVKLSVDERKKKIEKYIAKKIADKLNKSVEKIDFNISIISMGLDSLNAIELKNDIEKIFNIDISIVTLMKGPSVTELALLLSKQFDETKDIKHESKIIKNNEYPLSYGQRALWSIYKTADANLAYNINFGLSIYSDLNISHLERCLYEIVQRHNSLKTVYIDDNDKTIQKVVENNDFRLQTEDAEKWGKAFLDKEIREFTHQAFDLKKGPVFRIKLYKRAEKHYILIFSFHHIAVDLWSLELIIDDLMKLYNSDEIDKNGLPETGKSYLDFAEYQNNKRYSEDWQRMSEYWNNELSGELPYLNIPLDNPRPSVKTYNGSTYSFRFDNNISKKLKEYAKDKGITLFTLLLGLYKLFLYRITGQNDILVGTPSLRRNRSDFEKIVGYFVNPMVIRSDFSEDLTFEQFTQNLNRKVINGLDNQEYPFGLIVDKIKPERKVNQNPIFQTMFVFEKASHLSQLSEFILGQDKKRVTIGKLEIEPYPIKKEASQFDITLIVAEENSSISASFEYDTDLFNGKTVERFAEQLKVLAANVISNSQYKLKEISLLSQNEKKYYIHDLNDTAVNYPTNQCINKMIEKYAMSDPHSIAVTDKNRSVTYKELNEKADTIAYYLKKRGVSKDIIVGIRMERSVEVIIGMLAILKSGGAYMPIDVNYPAERVNYMLRDAGSPILIVNDNNNLDIDENVKIINYREVYNNTILLAKSDTDFSPDNLAYVIYTSGSTGKPKGVMVEHHSLTNMIYAHRSLFNETDNDRISQLASIGFDACVFEIWPALTRGAELCIVEDEVRNDPDRLKEWLIQNEINIAFVPTPIGEILLTMDWPEEIELRSLRIAGDKLHKYPETELPFKVYNLYGPTEATVWATCYEVPLSFSRQAPPIGKPIDNVCVYILDENMNPCAQGVKGEIYIGGSGITRGYIKRPDLNSQVFLPDPFSGKKGGRLYKTGDLGYYLPDGNIAYAGRKDFQVKIRGFRIELEEIESAINQYPSVKHSAVTVRENTKGIKQLIAYITFNDGEFAEEHIIRNWLKEKVPEYMIPHIFITLDKIPLTINGKVDKKKLPEPVSEAAVTAEECMLPETHKEKVLKEIWSDVLSIKNIGIDDNFFNLGGDSILAIQVVSRAKKYGLKITPNQLFKNQSIRELTESAGEDNEEPMIQSDPVRGEVPLTPIQHWFFEQNLNNPAYWNQGILLKVNKFIDPSLLKISALELSKQHDMLRAYYKKDDAGIKQIITGGIDEIDVVEYNLPETDDESIIEKITGICNKHQADFTLGKPPLFKIFLFNGEKGKKQFIYLLAHHLIADGVSWRIIVEDLFNFYEQLSENNKTVKPCKSASYKEWADALQEYAKSPALAEDFKWWMNHSWEEYIPIPRDFEVTPNLKKDTGLINIELDTHDTGKILKEVHKPYNTNIKEILLTGLALAFKEWTGKDSIVVDLEGHGRSNDLENIDLSRTVGWFTSVYPVFIDLKYDGIGYSIKNVKEVLRNIPGNGISYGVLKYLGNKNIREKMRSIPEGEICFNYLGRLDTGLSNQVQIELADNFRGTTIAENNERRYLIEINGYILDNKLRIEISFNKMIHKQSAIEKLAINFKEQLRNIIEFTAGAKAEPTPSDYPLAHLNQSELNMLIKNYGDIKDIYLLSLLQENIFYQSLFRPEPGLYIEQLSCTLGGGFNPEIFEKSWNKVIERHQILRTVFKWEGLERPVQIVLPAVKANFEKINITGGKNVDKYIGTFLKNDLDSQFELDKGPLMRFGLIKINDDRYKFIWTHHHLLLDGWSLSLILKEVFQLYNCYDNGREILSEKVIDYKRYIDWISKQNIKKAEHYFKDIMNGFEKTITTGYEMTPIEENSDIGSYEEVKRKLSIDLSRKLNSFAKDNRITLNTIFQGIWALLLSKYSGEKDIVFGSTFSGRSADIEDVESIIGMFINVLPVRIQVEPETDVVRWLKDIQIKQSELRQYEYTPLVEVQNWSRVPNDMPFFESIVVFENYPLDEAIFDGYKNFKISDIRFNGRTTYPLHLRIVPGQRCNIDLVYDKNKYSKSVIDMILDHLEHLLSLLTDSCRKKVKELRISNKPTVPEKNFVHPLDNFEEFKETDAEQAITTLFEKKVRKYQYKTAVKTDSYCWTYSELNNTANYISYRISDKCKDEMVGICFEHDAPMIAAILGVLKAGKTYIPLDPGYPLDRLKYIINDTDIKTIVTDNSNTELIEDCKKRDFNIIGFRNISPEEEYGNLDLYIEPDRLAYVLYTSGSTGNPKGVMQSHKNVLRHIKNYTNNLSVNSRDNLTLFSSYSFDASIMDIWGALLNGACLFPYNIKKQGIADISKWIEKNNISIFHSTPTVYRYFTDTLDSEIFDKVRIVVMGGEEVLKRDVEQYKRHFNSGCIFVNGLGPSESTLSFQNFINHQSKIDSNSIPVGYPVEGMEFVLLDDFGNGTDVFGEIGLIGRQVALGYWNKPEMTSESFTDIGGHKRIYRTGDLGRILPNGKLVFCGRKDLQVKIRGYRVELSDIETVINRHGDVHENVVVCKRTATEENILISFIRPVENKKLNMDLLRNFVKERLPGYMVPDVFIPIDKIPLTPTGKVNRKELLSESINYNCKEKESNRPYAPPQSEIEKKLVQIWQDILPVDNISIYDNFFEIGGHSLLLAKVHSILSKEKDFQIELTDMFKYPTISSLANYISNGDEKDIAVKEGNMRAEKRKQDRRNRRCSVKE